MQKLLIKSGEDSRKGDAASKLLLSLNSCCEALKTLPKHVPLCGESRTLLTARELKFAIEDISESLSKKSCRLLEAVSRDGLGAFKSILLNNTDSAVVRAVKEFLESVRKTRIQDSKVLSNLKDPEFLEFIYPKVLIKLAELGQKEFKHLFASLELYAPPSASERAAYGMAKEGICYGASVLTTIEDDMKDLDRHTLLLRSTSFQKEYHDIMNPPAEEVLNRAAVKICAILMERGDTAPFDAIRNGLGSPGFRTMLSEAGINVGMIIHECKLAFQEEKILTASSSLVRQFRTPPIFENMPVQGGSVALLGIVNDTITEARALDGEQGFAFHLTFQENEAFMRLRKDIIPSTHDVLIKVKIQDRDVKEIVFSDLQELGVFQMQGADAQGTLETVMTTYFEKIAKFCFKDVSAKRISQE